MQQRFIFDIARYIQAHKRDPLAIVSRAIRYVADDMFLRRLFKYWVNIGMVLQKYAHVQPVHFDGNRVYIETNGKLYFRYISDYNRSIFSAEFGNIWEKHEVALLEKYTPEKGIFFDIGASFGWFSIHLASMRGASVYAFEPNKSAYTILQDNIVKNALQERITARQLAVGDKTRSVLLADTIFFGNYVIEKKEEGIRTKKVAMISIDEYMHRNHIPRIHSIKCDIEGAELLVLRGARKSLYRFRPCVLLEIHEDLTKKYGYMPQDIFTLFSSMNYRYYRITEQGPRQPTGDIQKELQTAHNFFFYSAN